MLGSNPVCVIHDDIEDLHRIQTAAYIAHLKGPSARRAAANDRAQPNHPTNKRAKIKAARAQRRKSRG